MMFMYLFKPRLNTTFLVIFLLFVCDYVKRAYCTSSEQIKSFLIKQETNQDETSHLSRERKENKIKADRKVTLFLQRFSCDLDEKEIESNYSSHDPISLSYQISED